MNSDKRMNIAIVGATGLVGREFLKLMEERNFKFTSLFLFASGKSSGKTIKFKNKNYPVLNFDGNLFKNIDIAFFSAGNDVDKILVPIAAHAGTVCIDNSSAFRMDKNIPLIVPEVNFLKIGKKDKIIANPNCSTIQLVLVLNLLSKYKALDSVDVSTYQAVSGGGIDSLNTYLSQVKGNKGIIDTDFHGNIIQHIGPILKNGYCDEELKIINETRKILNNKCLKISATTMRVPVANVHTESVIVRFKNNVTLKKVRNAIENTDGTVILVDETDSKSVDKSNITFVSRLKADLFRKNQISMIITADNLRVGAALNGIKIAERIINEN